MKLRRYWLFVLVIMFWLSGMAVAQIPLPSPLPPIDSQISLDKVKVAAFWKTSEPIGRLSVVTAHMTMQNLSPLDLRVKWRITLESAVAAEESISIPKGGVVTVQAARVAFGRGMRTFSGVVDPGNVLHEPRAAFQNNRRSLSFPVGPHVVPRNVQMELDYGKAADAGAFFFDNPSTVGRCKRLGIEDSLNGGYAINQPGIVFVADCSAIRVGPIVAGSGGLAKPGAYFGFKLKNGWRVKSFTQQFSTSLTGETPLANSLAEAQALTGAAHQIQTFEIAKSPSIGTDDPSMAVKLSVEPGAVLKVYVKIIIQGPPGTDPYCDNPGPCGCLLPVTTTSGPGCARPQGLFECEFNCGSNSDCDSSHICISGSACNGKCAKGRLP